jgi:AcrR family transcriptional regulator
MLSTEKLKIPQMALRKEEITSKALELLQRDGIKGVTLRKLASVLNIEAATLYWHFKNKIDLFESMSDEMLRSAPELLEPPQLNQTWQSWLKDNAQKLRQVLLSYRDSGMVLTSICPRCPDTFMKLGANAVTVLCEQYSFDVQKADIMATAVYLYTFSAVIQEQTWPGFEEPQGYGAFTSYLSPAVNQQLKNDSRKSADSDGYFHQILDSVIEGAPST